MRIGIISDTHGLLRPEVIESLDGCEAILHGGDINKQEIIDQLEKIAPVYAVRGKLGAPEWMARKSAAFGDHYQAVAKTTGLHLISKEILARRGLLSCVDYYLG